MKELQRLVKTIDSAIVLLNSKSNGAMRYSDSMSLEDWARYVAHAKPMNHEDLLKADPNSSAPIFMEQKKDHISKSA